MVVVEQEIRNLGYGGDTRPALITYLAASSRLLAMRQGTMPVHLPLVGEVGVGMEPERGARTLRPCLHWGGHLPYRYVVPGARLHISDRRRADPKCGSLVTDNASEVNESEP